MEMTMDIINVLGSSPIVLTEGAVVERLRRDPSVELHPLLLNAPLVTQDESPGARALSRLHRLYIDIAQRAGRPIICFTDTWRASRDRIARAGLHRCDLNGAAVRYLAAIRAAYGDYARRIAIAGLVGPSGDAYRPGEALPADEAAAFHRHQVDRLALAGVDLLFAATLPALSEASGIARAMSATGLPFMLSFVIRPSGTLLDGTPIRRAIEVIDESSNGNPPLGYMVNCVYPTVFGEAIKAGGRPQRLLGLQANASPKSPEELDGSETLESESPETFASEFAAIARELRLQVLGGCCGTDERHLDCLAAILARQSPGKA